MAKQPGKIIIVGRTREDASTLASRLSLEDAQPYAIEDARANGILATDAGLILAPGVSAKELQEPTAFEDRPETLLNAIGEGVCLCESDGRAAWSNQRFKHFDERVRRRVEAVCRGRSR